MSRYLTVPGPLSQCHVYVALKRPVGCQGKKELSDSNDRSFAGRTTPHFKSRYFRSVPVRP